MLENIRTGRQARGSPRPSPWPISPAPVSALLRTERFPPDLPPGACFRGRVRVPLSLHVAPWARLYRLPDGELTWWVRLPDAEGCPRWRVLARDEPVRWALASGLCALAREATRLVAASEVA